MRREWCFLVSEWKNGIILARTGMECYQNVAKGNEKSRFPYFLHFFTPGVWICLSVSGVALDFRTGKKTTPSRRSDINPRRCGWARTSAETRQVDSRAAPPWRSPVVPSASEEPPSPFFLPARRGKTSARNETNLYSGRGARIAHRRRGRACLYATETNYLPSTIYRIFNIRSRLGAA